VERNGGSEWRPLSGAVAQCAEVEEDKWIGGPRSSTV
jgi:hypothetical protein